MVCIYLLASTGAFIAGFDFLQGLLSLVASGSAFPFADAGAKTAILASLPHRLVIHDPQSAK